MGARPVPLSVLGRTSVIALTFSVAGFAIGAQVCLNLGCSRVGSSSVAALIATMEIPLALLNQLVFFGRAPKLLEVVGACVVLVACVSLTVIKQLKANRLDDTG